MLPRRGDRSNEDFRFASFFPAPVQPAVDKVADALGSALKLKQDTGPAQGASHPSRAAAALPGTDDADATRRRWADCMNHPISALCTKVLPAHVDPIVREGCGL